MCLYFLIKVKYECLAEEIKIGDYYLRLLLEEDENEESGSIKRSWVLPLNLFRFVVTICFVVISAEPLFKSRYEFFNELYHRFLLTPKVNMKCLCLQALAIVYGRCHEEIGPFTDTRYIIGMLERVRTPWGKAIVFNVKTNLILSSQWLSAWVFL